MPIGKAKRAARLPAALVRALDRTGALKIRVETTFPGHRFIGIWVVVTEGRAFIRSYYRRRGGWHEQLGRKGTLTIRIGSRTHRVRGVAVRSERLRDAVDAAYAAKYGTPGSRKYVVGFRTLRRRATTTELLPTSGR